MDYVQSGSLAVPLAAYLCSQKALYDLQNWENVIIKEFSWIESIIQKRKLLQALDRSWKNVKYVWLAQMILHN